MEEPEKDDGAEQSTSNKCYIGKLNRHVVFETFLTAVKSVKCEEKKSFHSEMCDSRDQFYFLSTKKLLLHPFG